MKDKIERPLMTKGKDENIMGMVVFPYDEDDVRDRFGVEDLSKELYFVDKPSSKMTVPQFNYIIQEASARAAKIEDQINTTVRFLQLKLGEHPDWRGRSENLPINWQDGVVWSYCMKEDYRHPDDKVSVYMSKGELVVYYGEKK